MEIISIIMVGIILAQTSYLTIRQVSGVSRKGLYGAIFVDTSALIDGRIMSIASTGFFNDTELVIPRSVIAELQFLADGSDSEKRGRARHGLDVVSELQGLPEVRVRIMSDGESRDVDTRLLELAKRYRGSICTIDYNLNKVARVEKIKVLNINDLAKNLRMAFLPGEKVQIALTQKGQESSQAVGHLDDGTMVVVDQASAKIGSSVEIEVVRSLQTAAGRMVFAKLASQPQKTTKQKIHKQTVVGRRGVQPARVDTPAPVDKGQSGVRRRDQQVRPQTRPAQNNRQSLPRNTSRTQTREDDLIRLLNGQE